MKETVYLTKEELLQYYRETIQQSGGGMADIRDEGGLDKVLVFIQDDNYYPTFEDKLTYLVFGLCHGHYFADGNKRISLVAGAHFLIKNKYSWAGFHFLPDMEAYIWHVAAGNIDKDLLLPIIHSVIHHEDMDEATKLRVIHAMEKSPLYSEEV
uniref:Fic family protein n=1 Tax=Candidatus Cryptobacteroides bacterium TaxID=3085639 RepID=UPI004027EAB4